MNLNKQIITYSFIIIFIIITFIHLYKINNKNNNNDKENFADLMEDQNLQGFSVSINSMSQVLFGNTPQNKRSLLSFMDEKVSKTELNNKINDAMPELSIISYAGSNPPTGWQLCDGENLEKSNVSSTTPVNEKFAYDSNGDPIKTPDLRGRFILGSGKGDGLTQRDIHTNGGEETHTLTVNEIPSHHHSTIARDTGGDWYGPGNLDGTTGQGGNAAEGGTTKNYPQSGDPSGDILTTDNTNVSPKEMPHNNMPPYYVLTYIIKQPSPPTSS